MEGRIVLGVGGLYTVRDAQGAEYVLRAKGKFRRLQRTPLVGDLVRFTPGTGDEHGWVDDILPRCCEFVRPPAANVQLMVIVTAPVPAPDLLLVDRLLVSVQQQRMDALLVLNKQDLDPSLSILLAEEYGKAGIPFLSVSVLKAQGLDDLAVRMRGKLCCMAGQSGVGKSSILNALLGTSLETGAVSRRADRGRQTTRRAELIEREGIAVLDTPGFSLWETSEVADPVTLQDYYPEMLPYLGQCRFNPCYHAAEPGCAVLEAEAQGELNRERMERYRMLLNEWKQTWRERYD